MISQRDLLHTFMDSHDDYMIIILDACRYDFYSKFREAKKVRSEGTSTPTWLKNTFVRKSYDLIWIGEVHQIQENTSVFGKFKEIRNLVELTDHPSCYPYSVTEEASKNQDENLIIHYFKPHAPYFWEFPSKEKGGYRVKVREEGYNTPEHIGETLGEREMKNLYEKNVLFAIQEYERLLKMSDRSYYVVTSDHGELMGENKSFGHSSGKSDPKLREVPWRIEKR